jgi:hypothetical protein
MPVNRETLWDNGTAGAFAATTHRRMLPARVWAWRAAAGACSGVGQHRASGHTRRKFGDDGIGGPGTQPELAAECID